LRNNGNTTRAEAHDEDALALRLPYAHLCRADLPRDYAEQTAEPVGPLAASSGEDRALRVERLLACCAAVLYRHCGADQVRLDLLDRDAADRPLPLTIATSGKQAAYELQATGEDPGKQAPAAAQVALLLYSGRRRPAIANSSPYDLLFCVRSDGRLRSPTLVHDRNRLPEAAAERLLRHFQWLLANPELQTLPLAELPMLSDADRKLLKHHGDGTLLPVAGDAVHLDVERHAQQRADAVAVRHRGRQLSYAELNVQANRLAHYLLNAGVGNETRVMVCLDPHPDCIVALLAILKAGATYVPVNPAHPRERINTIISDAVPQLILVNESHQHLFSDFDRRVTVVERLHSRLQEQPDENPRTRIHPQQDATVFYTSGTTGKPKGVAASHANLRHCIDVSRRQFAISSDDVMPTVAAYTFSISIFELLAPLSAGGTLLLLDRNVVLDAAAMSRTLQQVSIAHIGPSLLGTIVQYIEDNNILPRAFARLRHLSSGGDTVPAELLQRLRLRFPHSELYVIYGCSEISLMGCTWRADTAQSLTRSFVGKPFANVRLRVLDDDGNCLPPGCVGDVCFAGPGVTRGYLKAPDEARNAWFDRATGGRWYRTGDRGCLHEDGNLELLGRRDFQIQLRGMRIELAEIECQLRQIDGIANAVVMPARTASGSEILATWYVPSGNTSVTAESIRRQLLQQLPDYMVPAFYQPLERLPLNHNMKVDRRALPALALPKKRAVSPPQTATEKSLAGIWRQVLHIDDIGLEDNFLLLGGDSLLAMQMIMRVREELGVELDGMQVLREPLRVLAAIADADAGNSSAINRALRPQQLPQYESFFFGPDSSLYGIWHPPAGAANGTAVLICPALGHEYSRSHFLLRSLAERLAAAGVAVLRFDYFGIADSLGTNEEASLQRWREDIRMAWAELERRSGRASISVLGVRLGANLAVQALPSNEVSKYVLWDPLLDGEQHVKRVMSMHARRVRRLIYLRNFRAPRTSREHTELLGIRLADTLVEELRQQQLAELPGNAHCLLSSELRDAWQGEQAVLALDASCDWYDVGRIGTAVTAAAISNALFLHLNGDQR
jgi:amino acid adenylation domain-containing protein